MIILLHLFSLYLSQVDDGAAFEYLDLWSSPFSWGVSEQKPVDGDFVVVPEGQRIVLDEESAVLKMLLIKGLNITRIQKSFFFATVNTLLCG